MAGKTDPKKPTPARPAKKAPVRRSSAEGREKSADDESSSANSGGSGTATKQPRRDNRRTPKDAKAAKESGAKAASSREESGEADLDHGPSSLTLWLRDSPSWLTSLVVHMAILLVLALWMLPQEIKSSLANLTAIVDKETEEEVEEIVEEEVEEIEIDTEVTENFEPQPEVEVIEQVQNLSAADDVEAAAVQIELSDFGVETAPKNDLMTEIGAATGSGLSGRGPRARASLAKAHGGTPGSEKAVALALKWLAAHQLQDGGWSFDHRVGACQGRCANPGSMANMRNAATAMALLPFLGAGQTHKDGNYKETVKQGLYYLVKHIKLSRKGGDLTDPGHGMYSHGLAAICLSEAYGMTQEQSLMAPAQAAVAFCVTGQDQVTGGWGYHHGKGNDTSVAGWQIMAMKSGQMAYLQVPPSAWKGAYAFLDSVQVDSGSGYGYRSPGRGQATTAVGLLCRMYMGWKKDHPSLERGVQQIAKWGPSGNNMYYNYYAMQVMFQNTSGKGEMWKTWNEKIRDQLINSQAKDGHTEGSWTVGRFNSHGGRIYSTSMACMCLEVYYRHMPIYKEAATVEDFPLE